MIRRSLSAWVAVGVTAALYFQALPPRLSEREATELASRFTFEGRPLPVVSKKSPQRVRQVHPSLAHLSGWISFVGAAVSLGDLDQNGLPDDIVYVDSRFDEVTVCPVPGTGDRYSPFLLRQRELSFDETTTAPMGTLLGDFNEDGAADILVYFWGRSPLIYLHAEVADSGPLSLTDYQPVDLVTPPQVWHTSAVTQADFDGDGQPDLAIGNYNPDGARTLDASDTEGGLEEMMGSWGRATNGGVNRFFLGLGGAPVSQGRPPFREQTAILPDDVARGWTFALGGADLNDDMLPELYVVQDFGADALLLNESVPGQLKFRPLRGRRSIGTPRSMTVGLDSFNGMGVDFADISGDGEFDFIVSNITSDFGLHQSNLVFVRDGSDELMDEGIAPFSNASEKLGLARSGFSWDVKCGDFDNDGTLEVLQATGMMQGKTNRWPEMHELALANEELARFPLVYPSFTEESAVSAQEPNPFFVRRDGRYYNIGGQLGEPFSRRTISRGIATADVDGDGRLDMAFANHFDQSFFFRNRIADPGQFVGFHVRLPLEENGWAQADHDRWTEADDGSFSHHPGHPNGSVRSRPAVGAQVEIAYRTADGEVRAISQVDGGNGHSGQRAPDVHFGLGDVPPETRIAARIRWRDRAGQVRRCTVSGLRPTWHTIYLSPGPDDPRTRKPENEEMDFDAPHTR